MPVNAVFRTNRSGIRKTDFEFVLNSHLTQVRDSYFDLD